MFISQNGRTSTSRKACCGVLTASKAPTAPERSVREHAVAQFDADTYRWSGTDEYSHLDDRKELPPLPLPDIDDAKRIVLVRHGQSTWNAEGRIQGSTDFAVLTEKGQAQAATTHEMLADEQFDKLFTSPLARAVETANIVWDGGPGPRAVLEGLREIDLYSFQGLLKAQGIERYGEEFSTWQKAPAEFSIDGRRPVVELWHRASMVWQQILLDADVDSCALVVAHNAVNQALVATAVGIGPEKFRRLLQSNAATTVLDFVPRVGGGPPVVTIDRLNQVWRLVTTHDSALSWASKFPQKSMFKLWVSEWECSAMLSLSLHLSTQAVLNRALKSPSSQVLAQSSKLKRIVLVRHAATASAEDSRLHTTPDEPCSSLGEVQAMKTAEFLMDTPIENLLVSPAERAVQTAGAIAKCQSLARNRAPRLQVLEELKNIGVGNFAGRLAREVQQQPLPPDSESMSDFWARVEHVYQTAVESVEMGTVCVVAHAAVHSGLLCRCLGLDADNMGKFRMATAGVTLIEFPYDEGTGIIRFHNYTAHLGRWSVPIARDGNDVCGIDGCF